jgi:hypothetical protein
MKCNFICSRSPSPRYKDKLRIPLGEVLYESSVITGTDGVPAFSEPCIHIEKSDVKKTASRESNLDLMLPI